MPVIETQTVTTGGKGKTKTVRTTKTASTQARNGSKNRQGKKTKMGGNYDQMVLRSHLNMLVDPCNASLNQSAYAGRAGITNRFSAISSYTAGGDSSAIGLFSPAALTFSFNTAAGPGVTVTPVFNQALAGNAFIAANSDAMRVIGFCLNISYLGTELDRKGAIYGGNLPSSAIPAGSGVNVDTAKVLLTSEARTPDRELELRWFPGVQDAEYNKWTDPDVFKDTHNTLVLCMENLPAGLQVRIRHTVIVEWLPKLSIGMSMTSPVGGSNPPAAYEHLHAAVRDTPGFVNAFTDGMHSQASKVANAAGQYAVNVAVGAAGAGYGYYRQTRGRRIGY